MAAKPARFVIAAGGTGGHVFPAAALAKELLADGHEVTLWTDARGERYRDSFPGCTVRVHPSGGLVSGRLTKRIGGLLKLAAGGGIALLKLLAKRPKAVIGFGGYPSAPPLIAAQLLAIPTILHEQNSVMGAANRLAGRKAKLIACSFPKTVGLDGSRDNVICTGNPVDTGFAALPDYSAEIAPVEAETNCSSAPAVEADINLIIMGGSLGAQAFNDAVPQALAQITAETGLTLRITHQCPPGDTQAVEAAYAASGLSADVCGFIADVPAAIADADMIIARSGATTVAEIAAAGRPALFIPMDLHADQHQVLNARALSDHGGAALMMQSDLTADALAQQLLPLLTDPVARTAMAQKARTFARPDAAHDLAALVKSVARV